MSIYCWGSQLCKSVHVYDGWLGIGRNRVNSKGNSTAVLLRCRIARVAGLASCYELNDPSQPFIRSRWREGSWFAGSWDRFMLGLKRKEDISSVQLRSAPLHSFFFKADSCFGCAKPYWALNWERSCRDFAWFDQRSKTRLKRAFSHKLNSALCSDTCT